MGSQSSLEDCFFQDNHVKVFIPAHCFTFAPLFTPSAVSVHRWALPWRDWAGHSWGNCSLLVRVPFSTTLLPKEGTLHSYQPLSPSAFWWVLSCFPSSSEGPQMQAHCLTLSLLFPELLVQCWEGRARGSDVPDLRDCCDSGEPRYFCSFLWGRSLVKCSLLRRIRASLLETSHLTLVGLSS